MCMSPPTTGRAPARRPGRPYSVPQPPGPPPSLLPPTARRQRRPTEFHIMSTVEAEEEDGEGGGGGEGEGGKEKEVPRAQAKADKDGKPDVRRGKLTVTVLNGKVCVCVWKLALARGPCARAFITDVLVCVCACLVS